VDTRLDQSFIDQQRDLLGPAFGAMITAYLEGMQKGVLAMRAALASGEVHELRGHAHKAKSSSLQMGAEGMVERCKELEMACLDETPIASLGAQIDQVAKAFELLRPLIEAQRP
jgi:HPt (histidine-containing phosphotransfer) domain-containing protein